MRLTLNQKRALLAARPYLGHRRAYFQLFSAVQNRPSLDPNKPVLRDDTWIYVDQTKPGNMLYAYDTAEIISLGEIDSEEAPFPWTAWFTLNKDDGTNHKGDAIETTVGRFAVNAEIFMNTGLWEFPYINKYTKIKAFTDPVLQATKEKKLTVDQMLVCMGAAYNIQSMGEISSPTLTEKALRSNPKKDAHRKKRVAEEGDNIHNPEVFVAIEDELDVIDRENIDGDKSEIFYDSIGKKSRDVHRKKMDGMVGGIEDFKDEVGSFVCIPTPLKDELQPENMVAVVNEIRKGSYQRGKKTSVSGDWTKILARIFSSVMIDTDDCGSKEGILTEIREYDYKKYVGIYVVGSKVPMTETFLKQHIGKKLNIRTPARCKRKPNFCYRCCGQPYKDLQIKRPGALLSRMTSAVMLKAMKNMHGTKIVQKVFNIFNFVLESRAKTTQ